MRTFGDPPCLPTAHLVLDDTAEPQPRPLRFNVFGEKAEYVQSVHPGAWCARANLRPSPKHRSTALAAVPSRKNKVLRVRNKCGMALPVPTVARATGCSALAQRECGN